jgi:2-iminobutanoate/2-iminopropanoate deaminase
MPETKFVFSPDRDVPLMESYGMGGAAVVDGMVFTAAMAVDLPKRTRLAEAETIADETRITFDKITAMLEAGGSSLGDVVKATVWLTDDAYRPEFWEVFENLFAPAPYPKCLTLVAGIGADCRVEIEVLAVAPGGDSDA